MTARKKALSVPPVLRIVGELTINRAAEFKPVLLATPAPVEIDLSGVTEFDTAGLQLLVLAKKQALAEQRTLHLTHHSKAVADVFELLDVAAFFGDPLVVDAAQRPEQPAPARPGHES